MTKYSFVFPKTIVSKNKFIPYTSSGTSIDGNFTKEFMQIAIDLLLLWSIFGWNQ
jgi:hypothetical protein